MKRTAYYLSCVLFALVIISCKLTILSFEAPDTADTGTAITLSITARADQTGDGAIVHGVVVQVPENWQVLSGKGNADLQPFNLWEDPAYEELYTPDAGYKVWVGIVSGASSQNATVSFRVRVMTGDFEGDLGETRSYALKCAVGALREDQWVTDDPAGRFNFSDITQSPYVRTISVTKVVDIQAPDPVTTLHIQDNYEGSITLNWTGYNEEDQGDVYAYRIYRCDSDCRDGEGDINGMDPVAQFPAGSSPNPLGSEMTYRMGGLNFGETYLFAVTAVDELLQENTHVQWKAITPIEGAKISGTIRDSQENPITDTPISVSVISGNPCGEYQWVAGTNSNFSDGTYTVSGLLAGSYYLQTQNGGANYLNVWWSSAGSTTDCSGAEAISVQFGETIAGKDFQMHAGGTISGKVTQMDGTTGIGNLYVYAMDHATGQWMGNANTDPDGNYAINGLPVGIYRVGTCSACSGLPYVDTFYDSVYQSSEATPVSVTAGQIRSEIDLSLAIGASISGTIKDSNGNPVTGVPILVNVIAGAPCGEYQWVAGIGSNPFDGTYTISGLHAGSYYLQTWNNGTNYLNEWWSSAGSTTDCSGAEAISVQFGETIAGKDFQMHAGGTISGKVTQMDGTTGIGNLYVYAMDHATGQWMGNANTDPDGNYAINGLPVGIYRVGTCSACSGLPYVDTFYDGAYQSSEATPVSVTAGQITSEIDLSLAIGASISGTIKDSNGNPVTGVPILVNVIAGAPCGEYQWVAGIGSNPFDGTYTVSGLHAGSYYLQTWNNGTNYLNEWWSSAGSAPDCNSAEAIPVQLGDTIDGKDFQLEAGGGISGRVTHLDGTTGIGNLYVFATDFQTGQWMGGVNTDSSGNYSINGLPAGNYRVMACAGCSGLPFIDTFYPGVHQYSEATPVSVTAGQTTSGIDISLAIGASITGMLKDSNANPIAGTSIFVQVIVGDPCGGYQEVTRTNSNPSDGTYIVSRIPAGSYYLQTWNNGANYLNEWWSSAGTTMDCSDAEAISVQFGETIAGIDFRLDPGSTISGRVTRMDGVTGIDNLYVFAMDYETGQGMGNANTGPDGSYAINGLPAGNYRVMTCAGCTGLPYVDELYDDVYLYDLAVSVAVTEGEYVSGIDFSLALAGTVSGTIRNRNGNPITDTSITVGVISGNPCGEYQWVWSSSSNPFDGTYSVSGFPAGSYYLRTWNNGANYLNEWWSSNGSTVECSGAQTIMIQAGETTEEKDFQLEVGGSRIKKPKK